ncbi:MAG TPA: TIGR00282 family metallophosphoesterase [bacterium]|nr:TIGR00282 family metallophosphoesterase [bacterium]HPN30062.1 TIGR00282 family metallophosphoesterase [bacterium]
MSKLLKVWFIGDIFGSTGRNIVLKNYAKTVETKEIDAVIVNGENSAGGFGITPKIADEFFKLGIDVITTGNHIWSKKEIYDYINKTPALIRPANFAEGNPGNGFYTFEKRNVSISAINLIGKVFIPDSHCPFRKFDDIYLKIKNKSKIILVDFHGEATSEKSAFAYYASGKAGAVVGTHTHIQTNDLKILDDYTAFITDAGMTGPYDNSIIGVDKTLVLKKFLTGMPVKFELAKCSKSQLNSVIITFDGETGAATNIEHYNLIDVIK